MVVCILNIQEVWNEFSYRKYFERFFIFFCDFGTVKVKDFTLFEFFPYHGNKIGKLGDMVWPQSPTEVL